MKLYQTTAQKPDDASEVVTWSGSQADASKQRSTYKKESFKGVSTDEVDVPTNKIDLLKFLNDNKVVI